MHISNHIPSGSPNGGLTTKAEAAVRVAKAVAAREARSAGIPKDNNLVARPAGIQQPSEAFGESIVRSAALNLTRPEQAKLELDIDPATERVIGRIVNKDTGEILRQIPSDSMLKLIEAAEKSFGSLIDRKF